VSLVDRARQLTGIVNPVGWIVLALGVLATILALAAGWEELAVLGAASLLLLLLSVPFLPGRIRVRVDVVLEPQRIVAGGTVAAALEVTNVASRRMPGFRLELPVGAATHRYGLPSLGAGERHEEAFTVRTERRGVIEVGPATTRRGDPLGLLSRDLTWTDVTEILVRPPMVPLDALGAGLLRDLEGVTTDAVSQSDLAFHALREYVPGDDLRHVHWRSSAKALAAAGSSADSGLLVRQYLDTRRSHATIVVDDSRGAWADEDFEDFETAMSVAASVAVRAVVDEFAVSFFCGDQATSGTDGTLVLDAVCRASPGSTGLLEATRAAAEVAPDTSLLFLVGGPGTGFETMQRAAATFAPEVRRLAVVVDPAAPSRVSEVGDLTVLGLGARDDLGAVLRWSLR
jgi:uncharacterized protein (DUF58 family)